MARLINNHYHIHSREICCTAKRAAKEASEMLERGAGIIAAKAHLVKTEKSGREVYRIEWVVDKELMLEQSPFAQEEWKKRGIRLNKGVD
jgi:hypothetical protein